eukprot:CAMPEP_0119331552 /NCGR_PEP_ID=MMETSP1333-20130426/80790_1 /TAXON_ID=418940 /ORGANISM="Scyphosphaera apsteinii, Strain RCC1455" /LENGTH=245 /DNA_ID=CAMNT_0007341179 /DNA_START=20 /DNA_END=754 /DNA_ORIENTATION=+
MQANLIGSNVDDATAQYLIDTLTPAYEASKAPLVDVSSDSESPSLIKALLSVQDGVQPMIRSALRSWQTDLFKINTASNGHPLAALGQAVLEQHRLIESNKLDAEMMQNFLLLLERDYGDNEYHNAIHGADVLLSLHLFLSKTGLSKRLSKLQLLAAFLAAICHDFRHPGTTSAHEAKVMSPLAIAYSDQSVLELHHLASVFALLNTEGLNVLGPLSAEDFRHVRGLMIEMVLHTDLAKHFDFIG